MAKCILIGYGQIGKAVYGVFSKYHNILIHDPFISKKYVVKKGIKADILLVTIPYTDNFITQIKKYQKQFRNIKSTIIFATVAIGTCKKLNATHSPIEGKHPNLIKSLRIGKRWIGGATEKTLKFFIDAKYKRKDISLFPEASWTEFLKLRSTSLYGLNIEFARYSKIVADKLKISFNAIQEFDKDYNTLYKKLKMPQFSRYILTSPKGNTGGHCIVPNAKILDKQFPSIFLKEVYKNKNKKKVCTP